MRFPGRTGILRHIGNIKRNIIGAAVFPGYINIDIFRRQNSPLVVKFDFNRLCSRRRSAVKCKTDIPRIQLAFGF